MKKWLYLVNTFLVVTFGTFRLGLRISKYHFNALKSMIADSFFLGLYNAYSPVHSSYVSSYDTWKQRKGLQKSLTRQLTDKLDNEMMKKVRGWISGVILEFDVNTPEYTAIFPNGRTPFNKGGQNERVEALKTLALAMVPYSVLDAIRTEVEDYYTVMNTLLETQKGAIVAVETASNALEVARVNMSNAQFANLGALINKFVTNLSYIESFFDLKAIRSKVQLIFTGIVKPLQIKNIVKRTLLPTDQVIFTNDGVTELRFYKGAAKDSAIGTVFITVAAGAETIVNASDVGDVNLPFWLVFNPDTLNEGDFEMEFV